MIAPPLPPTQRERARKAHVATVAKEWGERLDALNEDAERLKQTARGSADAARIHAFQRALQHALTYVADIEDGD